LFLGIGFLFSIPGSLMEKRSAHNGYDAGSSPVREKEKTSRGKDFFFNRRVLKTLGRWQSGLLQRFWKPPGLSPGVRIPFRPIVLRIDYEMIF
jgi:hypothetical protein